MSGTASRPGRSRTMSGSGAKANASKGAETKAGNSSAESSAAEVRRKVTEVKSHVTTEVTTTEVTDSSETKTTTTTETKTTTTSVEAIKNCKNSLAGGAAVKKQQSSNAGRWR